MLEDNLFNFLVYRNGKLAFSKYNFNFEKFQKDTNIIGVLTPSLKITLFSDFLKRNGSELDKPTFLKKEYEIYFDPITPEIQAYVSKYGVFHSRWLNYIGINYDITFFENNQFDLYQYPDELRIQDFIQSNNNFEYSKYNFNFDQYMRDWIISDNKIVAFSDFIFRNYKLSNKEFEGYIIFPLFQKYFIPVDQYLIDYLIKYSVSSHNLLSERILSTIDFSKYLEINGDLPRCWTVREAKEHFISFGQFERRTLVFNNKIKTPIQNARMGIATVFIRTDTEQILGTGFLFKKPNDANIYLITIYHLIEKHPDQKYIYVIFENDDSNNFTAQFRIIGYDIITDIMACIYDQTLTYNNNKSNINWSNQIFLEIDYSYNPQNGECVHLIGNIGLNDNLATLKTSIVNNNYSGGFNMFDSVDTIPNSLLLQSNQINNSTINGFSGAPVLYGDLTSTNSLKIIGMLIGSLKSNDNLLIAVDNFILINVIYNIIKKWDSIKTLDQSVGFIDNFISNGYPKSWLGVTNQYNHPVISKKYKELLLLDYVGGLLITNFIFGFDFVNEKFVFNSIDAIKNNVFPLYGPLINTKLHKRFTENNNVPLVIKSIIFYDKIQNQMVKINIGKFGEQQSYSKFIYGQNYLTSLKTDLTNFIQNNQTTINNINYYNMYQLQFGPIVIEYFYFNGTQWILDTEKIGGNTNDWYVDYTTKSNYTYKQHKFEYPIILLPFFNNYSISKYAFQT
jgi:hypothetical protein